MYIFQNTVFFSFCKFNCVVYKLIFYNHTMSCFQDTSYNELFPLFTSHSTCSVHSPVTLWCGGHQAVHDFYFNFWSVYISSNVWRVMLTKKKEKEELLSAACDKILRTRHNRGLERTKRGRPVFCQKTSSGQKKSISLLLGCVSFSIIMIKCSSATLFKCVCLS